MADFQDYKTIQIQVKAVQWDGKNETYEAIETLIPNKFIYTRPEGNLQYSDAVSKRLVGVALSDWIVFREGKEFIIRKDLEFNAEFEAGTIGTSLHMPQALGG